MSKSGIRVGAVVLASAVALGAGGTVAGAATPAADATEPLGHSEQGRRGDLAAGK